VCLAIQPCLLFIHKCWVLECALFLVFQVYMILLKSLDRQVHLLT
jgi:hypothetical protein